MTEFARLRFEGGYDPLPEAACAARIPLSSCITVVGPAEPLPAARRTPISEFYALETSPYPEDQPPDPLTLFPEADPQKQLELFSLAARWEAAQRDHVSDVYKEAEQLPAHRLYSQAVLMSLEQDSGDPPTIEQLITRFTKLYPRDTDAKKPRPFARWQVIEAMTRHWTKRGEHTIVDAWLRSKEIIPPTIVPTRSRKLRNLRNMRLAKVWHDTQKAYEKTKERQRTADEEQLASLHAYEDGKQLVQSVGKSVVDQVVDTFSHDWTKAGASRKAKKPKRPLTAKEYADRLMRQAVEEARHESRVQLQQLDGDELAKGIIDLALFPDITNNKPDFGSGALNTFILNPTTFRLSTARKLRRIQGLPTEYIAINSVLLLRGKPVYWRDLGRYFGMNKEQLQDSFGVLRQTFNEANQNLLLKEGPGMPQRKQEQEALCLNPRVRIVDMRREHDSDKVPQRVYSVLPPSERKTLQYGRMRGRRYEQRRRLQPSWASKQYPED